MTIGEPVMFGIEKDFQNLMEQVYGPLGEKKQMTEIQKVKAEIKMLEKKLSFLEELEKTKSPVEEAFKDYWGEYPETENRACGGPRWEGFQAGYNAAYNAKVAEREAVERNLKTSLQEMANGDVRPIDDVVEEAREERDWVKSRDQFMDKLIAELKGQTLTDLIWKWWEDVFTTHSDWDAENSIDELVNRIESFLPKEQSAAGSQNIHVECTVEGFNDCLNKIKRKLR